MSDALALYNRHLNARASRITEIPEHIDSWIAKLTPSELARGWAVITLNDHWLVTHYIGQLVKRGYSAEEASHHFPPNTVMLKFYMAVQTLTIVSQ